MVSGLKGKALRTPVTRLVPAYLALAALSTWPAVLEVGRAVPGSARTDLWNSLWSFWYLYQGPLHGQWTLHTTLLNHPRGGSLLAADLLGGIEAAPLVALLGLPAAYSLIVLFNLAFSGVVAHRFAEALAEHHGQPGHAAWVAGVGYATAPVLLSGVHNGTSEAFAGGWAALAAFACWRVAVMGGWGRVALAGVALFLASVASWYSAVVAFLFGGAFALIGDRGARRRNWGARWSALILGLALVAPLAIAVKAAATAPDSLVGIKGERETATVRRSTGAADPLGFVAPLDFRSPDFRKISRYGEDFFHCHYLGWTLLLTAGWGMRRRRPGALLLAGGLGAALSLGPVWVHDGSAVIFLDERALPLPYLLVERLPGFSSLSLLYRLAAAPALALALLAALGLGDRSRRVALAVVAAILLEGRLLSPLGALPDTSPVPDSPVLAALAAAPEGAVMNYPVVGGRGYLYEQTRHRKPLAGTLNFPNNSASRVVWAAILAADPGAPEGFARDVAAAARRVGVRYVVVHADPGARPDMHTAAVHALESAWTQVEAGGAGLMSEDKGTSIRVYRLW